MAYLYAVTAGLAAVATIAAMLDGRILPAVAWALATMTMLAATHRSRPH